MAVGRFWAVGVGPGDPELLTLKAVNILRNVRVIYHAGPHERQGRALEIIRGLLRPDHELRVVLDAPMSAVTADNEGEHYRRGVERIAADCRRGLDVALMTEGDPTLYSTAAHIWQLLAERAPEISIEVVPGVSSVTAAAARVGWPLAQRDETLAVVPAGYHADRLRELIGSFSSVCLLKVSQTLPAVAAALDHFGPEHEAAYVEELGTAREWITHDLSGAIDRTSYFALILVRQTDKRKKQGPGKVWLVGLGPGDPALLTARAREVLRRVEAVVGYEGYLKALEPLGLEAKLHASPIGAEVERATRALELARAGANVALVSSGDAGVYGMASLLLETAERMPEVEVEIVPGVTAAVAAAALLGAPLGYDFACVSLSDLLTRWDVIERRLDAAGRGDFVLALYNPVSRRRTWQLPRARDVLLQYRRPETPVGLVDKAHRPAMRVWHTMLGGLTAEGVGMETTLIVGNSRTRIVNGRMVTPRGYGERP